MQLPFLKKLPEPIQKFILRSILVFIVWKLLYHLVLYPIRVPDEQLTHITATITKELVQLNYPDKIIDENAFHYPGPKPFNRETAVLMMADSVEAASRSMKKHDAESIYKLVNDVIDNQIAQNQFSNCNITFRDITELKRLFCKMLGSIYHVRVEYSGAGI